MTSPEKRQAARSLRRRQTDAEVAVWGMLRNRQMLGWKFRRQQVVEGFVVDFFCAENRVVVEIDGGIHEEPEQAAADESRAAVLTATGLVIVRVRNDEVSEDLVRQRLSALPVG